MGRSLLDARVLVLAAGLLLGAAACTSGESSASVGSPGSPAAGTSTPATAGEPTASGPSATAPAATLSGPTYDNPVFPEDFPDPHVLVVDDTYYAYSTNSGTSNLPVISSNDLATWDRLGDGMVALPRWANLAFGDTWAPGVIRIGERYVVYHVSRDKESGLQCIGAAVADAPDGQFEAASEEPFICQVDMGGSIDAYPFEDDGKLYLYWKNDGNCCGKPVWLWAQELSPDGLALTGEPVQLIERDQPWERPLIENPAMVRDGDRYYLFYSGNWWGGHEYAVGYATCDGPMGPCTKPEDEPIFSFTPEATGPGGQAFFSDSDGDLWMAYHAWTGAAVGYPAGLRSLRIDPAAFEDGRPALTGPTVEPQAHDGA